MKHFVLSVISAAGLVACGGGDGSDGNQPAATSTAIPVAPIDPDQNVPPTVVPPAAQTTPTPAEQPPVAEANHTEQVPAPTPGDTAPAHPTEYAYADVTRMSTGGTTISISSGCEQNVCAGISSDTPLFPNGITIASGEPPNVAYCGQVITVKIGVTLPHAGLTKWRYGYHDWQTQTIWWDDLWTYELPQAVLYHVRYLNHAQAGSYAMPLVQIFQPINGVWQMVYENNIPIYSDGQWYGWCTGF